MAKRIFYHPPAPQTIYAYARAVCQQLGEKVDSVYNTPEVVNDFAQFVQLTSEIWVKHLNQQPKTDEILDKKSREE